jgi:hypothetical protein
MSTRHFQTGDLVHVIRGPQEIEAKVTLASSNGHSLMLEFDGMLGEYINMMPVLLHPISPDSHSTFRDLIFGREVLIELVHAA